MAKKADDTVLDGLLNVIDNATRMVVTSAEPANFAGTRRRRARRRHPRRLGLHRRQRRHERPQGHGRRPEVGGRRRHLRHRHPRRARRRNDACSTSRPARRRRSPRPTRSTFPRSTSRSPTRRDPSPPAGCWRRGRAAVRDGRRLRTGRLLLAGCQQRRPSVRRRSDLAGRCASPSAVAPSTAATFSSQGPWTPTGPLASNYYASGTQIIESASYETR